MTRRPLLCRLSLHRWAVEVSALFALLLFSCSPKTIPMPEIKIFVYKNYCDIILPGADTAYFFTIDSQRCPIIGILFSGNPRQRIQFKNLAPALHQIYGSNGVLVPTKIVFCD